MSLPMINPESSIIKSFSIMNLLKDTAINSSNVIVI